MVPDTVLEMLPSPRDERERAGAPPPLDYKTLIGGHLNLRERNGDV